MDLKTAANVQTEILQGRYRMAIDQTIKLLEEAKSRKPTTHLGHNLGNRAAELSEIAGQLDAMAGVINYLENEAKKGEAK